MALRVLLVFLAILLTTETERSKHLSTGGQLCLCGDRVVRIRVSSMDEKESFAVSCDKRCRDETKRETEFHSLRRRREIDQKKNECHNITRSPPGLIARNVTVAFHERENGSGWFAKVSWSPLTGSPQPWRGYCLFYTFDTNSTKEVTDEVFLQKNQTSMNIPSTFYRKQIFLKVVALPMSPKTNSAYSNFSYDVYRPTVQERSTSSPSKIPYWTKSSTTASKECTRVGKSLPGWIASDVTVTFHKRGNDSGWYVKVSWSPLTDPSLLPWKGYCVLYTISTSENPEPASAVFIQKNETSTNITSTASERQIFLKVVALPMTPYQYPKDYPHFIFGAHRPPATHQEISTSWTKSFTRTKSPDTVTYVSMSVGIIVGLALVVGLLVHFMCRKEDSIRPPLDFQYHAFIIYNNEDRLWMKNKLLPFLEEKHHLTCCIHYRDFVAGKPFRDCMAESVYRSHKVVALFSSNFVKSNYCKYELDLAIGRLVARRDRSLIVIRIDKVDCKQLPSELRENSFIDYSDHWERRIWKRKLLECLAEDSRSSNVTVEHNSDNNNTHDLGENRVRVEFKRLESTTSNDTVISIC